MTLMIPYAVVYIETIPLQKAGLPWNPAAPFFFPFWLAPLSLVLPSASIYIVIDIQQNPLSRAPPIHRETMKLTVKINNESSLSLTVPDNATVEDLKVAALISLPSCYNEHNRLATKNINLWYSGHRLDYSKTLACYNINPNSVQMNTNLVVHLTIGDSLAGTEPAAAGCAVVDDGAETTPDDLVLEQTPKKTKSKSRSKSKSKKCSFSTCTSTPLRMVGDCQFCQGKFCSKHRLLESHDCKGLKTCKDKCYERNALKLQSEQTVASKV